MSSEIAFETDSFAVTKQVWLKATDHLRIKSNDKATQIKRLSPSKVQIINMSGETLAEFSAILIGNKKIWTQYK